MDDSLLNRLKALGVQVGQVSPANFSRREKPPAIEDVLDGRIVENPFGQCFIVEKIYPPEQAHGISNLVPVKSLGILADLFQLPDLVDVGSDRCMFLDTETTGLSQSAGTFPFLTGLCRPTADGVLVYLLMARSPAEEPAMLLEMCRLLENMAAIVTYNGKTFDIPLLETRLAYHAISSPFRELGHIDLLHLTRRLWKHTLPSRSLGYIEMSILGLARGEDEVPGYLIPQMYYEYIKSGDARPLAGVLYHNEMDILSLIALLNYFLATSRNGIRDLNPTDILAVVETMIHSGQFHRVDELLDDILSLDIEEKDWPRIKKMTDWFRKQDRWSQAALLYEKSAESYQMWACLELAKYAENTLRDYDLAIHWCEQMTACLRTQNLSPYRLAYESAQIEKRLNRLLTKKSR